MSTARAYILQPSGRRLDLLNPKPSDWTDEDLAIGLSRTFRWGGYSKWPLPLSVAQHSLTVLAIRLSEGPLTAGQALRELTHDATEALFGGFDPIYPIRPHLGPEFAAIDRGLQKAVNQRYRLPSWSDSDYPSHKHADRLAATSEAYHVAGWSRDDIRGTLNIALEPLETDPLPCQPGMEPWEPWPPSYAAEIFFRQLKWLATAATAEALVSLTETGDLEPTNVVAFLPPAGEARQ
jgi:hypothetical protein